MIELSPDRIAAACAATITDGEPIGRGERDWPERAVADTRLVSAGDLFFGLPGERVDGGAHAAEAIAAGAWGVVVGRVHAAALRDTGATRVFAVDDPLSSLHGLARTWLACLRTQGCRVVGVTGSTGKTSTKDILVALLSAVYPGRAYANRQNFNTEVGMPLTVLEAPLGTRALVLEMAMRGMGQIRELAQIARPEVGVITNIGPVHIELVGSLERVAEAKAELIAELPVGGVAVVPAIEEALHPHMRSDTRVLTFAPFTADPDDDPLAQVERTAAAGADVRALSHQRLPVGMRVEVAAGSDRAMLEFNFAQAHNITNALAAIGAAHGLGIELEKLADGTASVEFSSLRGEEIELAGQMLVINDCYNANPTSMRAAIDHLAQRARERSSARVVAILGDMKELGPETDRYHREIGALAAARGVGLLLAVGDHGAQYGEGFGKAGDLVTVADAEQAAGAARELLAPGDTVLVKASRSVGLERVAAELQAKEAR